MKKKLLQVCVLCGLTLLSFSAHSDDQLKPELIAGAAVSGTATAVAGASSLRYFDKTRALTASAAVARNREKSALLWSEANAARKKFWISSIGGLISFANAFCGGLILGDHLKQRAEEAKIASEREKAKLKDFKQDPRDLLISGHVPAAAAAAN